jgi:hypothetical protein
MLVVGREARPPIHWRASFASSPASSVAGVPMAGGIGPVTLRCDFMSVPSQRNETSPSRPL